MKYLRATLLIAGLALTGGYLFSNNGTASQEAVPSSLNIEYSSPVGLEIPKVELKTEVENVGLNKDQTLQVPRSLYKAGWYSLGFAPQQPGPAVFTAHYGTPDKPGIFRDLKELREGDEIRVLLEDGTKLSYMVRLTESYPQSEFPTSKVYEPSGSSELRLITCAGDFDQKTGLYSHNLVVYAEL